MNTVNTTMGSRVVDEETLKGAPHLSSCHYHCPHHTSTPRHWHGTRISPSATEVHSFRSFLERRPSQETSLSSSHSTFATQPVKRRPARPASTEAPPTLSALSFFTPADIPVHSPSGLHKRLPKKSKSSPHIRSPVLPTPTLRPEMQHGRGNGSDNDESSDPSVIYTSWRSSSNLRGSGPSHARPRIYGNTPGGASRSRETLNPICTAPGAACAGETETELDEPPRQLPTARIVPSSAPIVPPNTLEQKFTPWLFELSRLLSIVPAVIGTIYNLYWFVNSPTSAANGQHPPERVDFFVSALWSILTGYQCLCLTTGLLARWKIYYPPLSTLIRLLALQGICWPATHLTLTVLEHEKRPVITWAIIGTTTCTSRSIQLWVTSNLWWERRDSREGKTGTLSGTSAIGIGEERAYSRRWGGKWGGRRWDWKEVGIKCVLPAGLVYFVMAWAEQLRREFSGC